MAKYPSNWGFGTHYSKNEEESVLLRVLIQILDEVAETNRLLRILLENTRGGISTTDGVSTIV